MSVLLVDTDQTISLILIWSIYLTMGIRKLNREIDDYTMNDITWIKY